MTMLDSLFAAALYVIPLPEMPLTAQEMLGFLRCVFGLWTEQLPLPPVVQLVPPEAPLVQLPVTTAPLTTAPLASRTTMVTFALHWLALVFTPLPLRSSTCATRLSGGGGGEAPNNEYRSRFGEPVPALVTTFCVAELTMPSRTA